MNNFYRKTWFLVVIILSAAGWQGCAGQGFTQREKGALIGSGIGAGTGAIIGNQTGHTGAGTAIGAGAGALAGGLIGESQRRQTNQIREARMTQQYGQAPQPSIESVPSGEVHTKYNPKTGETFPDRYDFDPKSGEPLDVIKSN